VIGKRPSGRSLVLWQAKWHTAGEFQAFPRLAYVAQRWPDGSPDWLICRRIKL